MSGEILIKLLQVAWIRDVGN